MDTTCTSGAVWIYFTCTFTCALRADAVEGAAHCLCVDIGLSRFFPFCSFVEAALVSGAVCYVKYADIVIVYTATYLPMPNATEQSIRITDLLVADETARKFKHLAYMVRATRGLSAGVPLIPESSDIGDYISNLGYSIEVVENTDDIWKSSGRRGFMSWNAIRGGQRLHTGFSVSSDSVIAAYLARHDLEVEFNTLKSSLSDVSTADNSNSVQPDKAVGIAEFLLKTEPGEILYFLLDGADNLAQKVVAVANSSSAEQAVKSLGFAYQVVENPDQQVSYPKMKSSKGWMVGGPWSGFSANIVVEHSGSTYVDSDAEEEANKALSAVRAYNHE